MLCDLDVGGGWSGSGSIVIGGLYEGARAVVLLEGSERLGNTALALRGHEHVSRRAEQSVGKGAMQTSGSTILGMLAARGCRGSLDRPERSWRRRSRFLTRWASTFSAAASCSGGCRLRQPKGMVKGWEGWRG